MFSLSSQKSRGEKGVQRGIEEDSEDGLGNDGSVISCK